ALPQFSYAAAGASVIALLCGLAAHGTFLAGGEYSPLARPAKFVTFLANGIGATLLGILAFALLTALTENPPTYVVQNRWMTPTGQIVHSVNSDGKITYTDLAGKPISEASLSADDR